MDGSKNLTQSLTLQSILIAVILFSCQKAELDLDKGIITEIVMTTGTLISLLMAAYGRVTATKVIK